ncbi:MAG: hypothetical protein KGY54_09470 [Oleiphilaceae bacterium]|nr:hypothetical protein [Oleiphilaceae bacterium]
MLKIKKRIISKASGLWKRGLYPLQDLQGTGLGPQGACYEHNGKPCIISVDLEDCRWFGASGLSYSNDSLHPYVRTLMEYEAGQCITYEGSYLQKYWQSWTPKNLAEYFDLELNKYCHPLLLQTPPNHNILPWSPSGTVDYMKQEKWKNRSDYRALVNAGCAPARSCGPKPDWFGEARFQHLVSIFKSIKKTGYRPEVSTKIPYDQQHILGSCLIREGQVRFNILNGQHRASVLSALGHTTAPIIVNCHASRGPGTVRREEVAHWPLVRLGILSANEALAIFDRIFDAKPPRELARLKRNNFISEPHAVKVLTN